MPKSETFSKKYVKALVGRILGGGRAMYKVSKECKMLYLTIHSPLTAVAAPDIGYKLCSSLKVKRGLISQPNRSSNYINIDLDFYNYFRIV
jgi:hypothetical protein